MSYRLTTHYLEMRSPAELVPARVPDPAPRIEQARVALPELNRFLYTAVGGDWHWRDRLTWTHADWMTWLDRADVQTWVLYEQGTPAGYIELERQAGDDVELAYFGLIPSFIGRGLGGHLLTEGIRRAWDMGAQRVWVHTCSLDGPSALANYQARGLHLYRTETTERSDPGAPDGPWPGAR